MSWDPSMCYGGTCAPEREAKKEQTERTTLLVSIDCGIGLKRTSPPCASTFEAASQCSMLELSGDEGWWAEPFPKKTRFPSLSPSVSPPPIPVGVVEGGRVAAAVDEVSLFDALPTITTDELFGNGGEDALLNDIFDDMLVHDTEPNAAPRRSPSPPPMPRRPSNAGPPLPLEISSFALPEATDAVRKLSDIAHAGVFREYGGVKAWIKSGGV